MVEASWRAPRWKWRNCGKIICLFIAISKLFILLLRQHLWWLNSEVIPSCEKIEDMKVKEESEKAGLKLNIQTLKPWYLAPSLHGEKVEAVTDFIFFGSKITVDSDCSH